MTENDVVQHFREELAKHNIEVGRADQEGFYHVSYAGLEMTVSLENVKLNAIRDNSFSPVDTLVESILSAGTKPATFAEVRGMLIPSLESSTIIVGNSLTEPITKQIELRYLIDKGNQLLYVDSNDIKKWNVSIDQIRSISNKNLDDIYRKAKISSSAVGGHILYYFETGFPLKSTFIISKTFVETYLQKFGGDFYAVLPTRDFCYFFSGADKDYFLPRLGSTVKKEYSDSGYKVSEEVVKIGKDGIEAIGSY